MTPLDYIKKGWCQNKLAEDKGKNSVDYNDPGAIKWCAVGAIWAAIQEGPVVAVQVERLRLCDKLKEIVGEDIINWNNKKGRTHQEVIGVFEKLV